MSDSDHAGGAIWWLDVAGVDDPIAFQDDLVSKLGLPHARKWWNDHVKRRKKAMRRNKDGA